MPASIPQDYYAVSAGPAPPFPRLTGTVKTEIYVIGGGYTGLSAALHLAEAGAQPVLLEAGTVGFGASGRNGGQIHTGLRKEQSFLEKWLGPLHARDLWSLTEEAKALVRTLVVRHRIDCALKDGLVIAAHSEKALAHLTEDTAHLFLHYGYDSARMMDAEETAEKLDTVVYRGARLDFGGGHLNPLDYARGLAKAADGAGAALWEHSPALALEPSGGDIRIHCQSGYVAAKQAVLACDAFTGQIAPALERYIGHVESFIAATAPLPPHLAEHVLPSGTAVADTRHVPNYYRKSKDGRLLFAGGESCFGLPTDIAALVRPRMLAIYPQLENTRIEYAWSGTVGLTRTRMPHFGRLTDRIFFAHGYSGQGVALATLGGKLLTEAAMGRCERFNVFARVPAKRFPGGKYLKKPFLSAALYALRILNSL